MLLIYINGNELILCDFAILVLDSVLLMGDVVGSVGNMSIIVVD